VSRPRVNYVSAHNDGCLEQHHLLRLRAVIQGNHGWLPFPMILDHAREGHTLVADCCFAAVRRNRGRFPILGNGL
jgi:hypothetical protein